MRRVALVLFLWLSSATATLAAEALSAADVTYLTRLGQSQKDLAANRPTPLSPSEPKAPEPLTGAPAGGVSGGGFGPSALFAVLIGLLTLAAIRWSKLRIAPIAWRSAAVVSLIERPG